MPIPCTNNKLIVKIDCEQSHIFLLVIGVCARYMCPPFRAQVMGIRRSPLVDYAIARLPERNIIDFSHSIVMVACLTFTCTAKSREREVTKTTSYLPLYRSLYLTNMVRNCVEYRLVHSPVGRVSVVPDTRNYVYSSLLKTGSLHNAIPEI